MALSPASAAAAEAIFDCDTHDELREASAAIKQRWSELCGRARLAFRVGDNVTFTARRGRKVSGVVTKINRKTIGVDAGVHGNWRVSPNVLTKV